MKTNTITVTVSGPTGSGKTHVAATIAKVFRLLGVLVRFESHDHPSVGHLLRWYDEPPFSAPPFPRARFLASGAVEIEMTEIATQKMPASEAASSKPLDAHERANLAAVFDRAEAWCNQLAPDDIRVEKQVTHDLRKRLANILGIRIPRGHPPRTIGSKKRGRR